MGTKHLTEDERISARKLFFQDGLPKSRVCQITGFSMNQVKRAIREQTPRARSGRLPRRPADATGDGRTKSGSGSGNKGTAGAAMASKHLSSGGNDGAAFAGYTSMLATNLGVPTAAPDSRNFDAISSVGSSHSPSPLGPLSPLHSLSSLSSLSPLSPLSPMSPMSSLGSMGPMSALGSSLASLNSLHATASTATATNTTASYPAPPSTTTAMPAPTMRNMLHRPLGGRVQKRYKPEMEFGNMPYFRPWSPT